VKRDEKKKKYRENGSLIGQCLTNPIQKSLVRRGPIELHMKLVDHQLQQILFIYLLYYQQATGHKFNNNNIGNPSENWCLYRIGLRSPRP